MNILRLRLLGALVCFAIWSSSCNTTDTGISKPVPDCFDGIQNQGEIGIDCGGPCSFPCPSKMTANVDGSAWESVGMVTPTVGSNVFKIDAANNTSTISIIHQGAFETGTYNLYQAMYTNLITGKAYFSDEGTITFTSWDHSDQVVSGTFSFKAWLNTGVPDTVNVTQGTFEFVSY